MTEVIEFDDRRFVLSRDGEVFEYAGRIVGEEDAPGIIGWEFGRGELEAMEAVARAGGDPFMDGPIGGELDTVVAAMNSLGAAQAKTERGEG